MHGGHDTLKRILSAAFLAALISCLHSGRVAKLDVAFLYYPHYPVKGLNRLTLQTNLYRRGLILRVSRRFS